MIDLRVNVAGFIKFAEVAVGMVGGACDSIDQDIILIERKQKLDKLTEMSTSLLEGSNCNLGTSLRKCIFAAKMLPNLLILHMLEGSFSAASKQIFANKVS